MDWHPLDSPPIRDVARNLEDVWWNEHATPEETMMGIARTIAEQGMDPCEAALRGVLPTLAYDPVMAPGIWASYRDALGNGGRLAPDRPEARPVTREGLLSFAGQFSIPHENTLCALSDLFAYIAASADKALFPLIKKVVTLGIAAVVMPERVIDADTARCLHAMSLESEIRKDPRSAEGWLKYLMLSASSALEESGDEADGVREVRVSGSAECGPQPIAAYPWLSEREDTYPDEIDLDEAMEALEVPPEIKATYLESPMKVYRFLHSPASPLWPQTAAHLHRVAARAIEAVPSDATVQMYHLLALEAIGATKDEVDAAFQRATQAGLASGHHLVAVYKVFLDVRTRMRADDQPSALNDLFASAVSYADENLGPGLAVDLLEHIVNLRRHLLGAPEDAIANEVTELLRPSMEGCARAWILRAESCASPDSRRGAFLSGISRAGRLDFPDLLVNKYLDFERGHGGRCYAAAIAVCWLASGYVRTEPSRKSSVHRVTAAKKRRKPRAAATAAEGEDATTRKMKKVDKPESRPDASRDEGGTTARPEATHDQANSLDGGSGGLPGADDGHQPHREQLPDPAPTSHVATAAKLPPGDDAMANQPYPPSKDLRSFQIARCFAPEAQGQPRMLPGPERIPPPIGSLWFKLVRPQLPESLEAHPTFLDLITQIESELGPLVEEILMPIGLQPNDAIPEAVNRIGFVRTSSEKHAIKLLGEAEWKQRNGIRVKSTMREGVTIYLYNIPKVAPIACIREAIQRAVGPSELLGLRIPANRLNGNNARGFAYVDVQPGHVKDVLQAFSSLRIDGNKIRANVADPSKTRRHPAAPKSGDEQRSKDAISAEELVPRCVGINRHRKVTLDLGN